jgi:hypothetical protein
MGIYGDGSAGALTVTFGTTLDLSTSVGLAALPAGVNVQYTDITVDGTLIVPSGTFLRATGNVDITGTIVVGFGARNNRQGWTDQGVALAPAGTGLVAGVAVTSLQAARILRAPVAAGGAGALPLREKGGAGGGSLTVAARGDINVLSGAVISANGQDSTEDWASGVGIAGAGGGAGGIVVLAARGLLSVSGQIRANGGQGADGYDGDLGNMEGGGGGGGGGIIHLLSPTAPTIIGTLEVTGGLAGATAGSALIINESGAGGACGGGGGRGSYQLREYVNFPTNGTPGFTLETVVPEPEKLFF